MNRAALQARLDVEEVRSDAYDLDGGTGEECLRLEVSGDGWVVYYAERGLRSNERWFTSEDEACAYVLGRLLRDPTTRRRPAQA